MNKLKAFKNVMDSVKKEMVDVSSLICWARTIRTGQFSETVCKEAFDKYVNVEDYHPSERKALLNFKKIKPLNYSNA